MSCLSSLMMWNLQSYPTTVSNERMWHFVIEGTHCTYFQGVKTPQPQLLCPWFGGPHLGYWHLVELKLSTRHTYRLYAFYPYQWFKKKNFLLTVRRTPIVRHFLLWLHPRLKVPECFRTAESDTETFMALPPKAQRSVVCNWGYGPF